MTNPSTGIERADADVRLDAFDVLLTTRALCYVRVLQRFGRRRRHVGGAAEDRGNCVSARRY